jgi:site-specific recombinase XerD
VRGLAELEKTHTGKRTQRTVATMNGLRRVLDRFTEFMEESYPALPVQSVRRVHIDHYVRSRRDEGIARSTQQRELSYLCRMFQLGVEQEIVSTNPCSRITISAPTPQEVRASIREYALSTEEQERLIDACARPYSNRVLLRRGDRMVECEMPETPPRYL